MPPDAETVQVKGLPAVRPDVGHVAVTVRAWPATVTEAEPGPVAPPESVAVTLTVFVPFVE